MLNLTLQIRARIHSSIKNLMNSHYVLVIVIAFGIQQWTRLIWSLPSWSLQSREHKEFERPLQGGHAARWWKNQNKISSHMIFFVNVIPPILFQWHLIYGPGLFFSFNLTLPYLLLINRCSSECGGEPWGRTKACLSSDSECQGLEWSCQGWSGD